MKKLLPIICIVMICMLIAFIYLKEKQNKDAHKAMIKENYYMDFHSDYFLESKYSGIGNFEVSQVKIETGEDILKHYWIWYPSELEEKQEKYPMIIVTNASNMAVYNYEPFFKRLASWGFIVVGNEDKQAGKGDSTSKTLDFMLESNHNNESLFVNKVDEEKIGIVGYSQGGAGAIRAVTEFENSNKYKALFTGSAAYALLSKNLGWEYDISKIKIPYFMTAGTGRSDDTGVKDIEKEFGGVAPLSSLVENYNGISEDVFKVRARAVGAEHSDMLACSDGYMTAWLLYQLQGDEEAGRVFQGEEAEILQNRNWQDIEINELK